MNYIVLDFDANGLLKPMAMDVHTEDMPSVDKHEMTGPDLDVEHIFSKERAILFMAQFKELLETCYKDDSTAS